MWRTSFEQRSGAERRGPKRETATVKKSKVDEKKSLTITANASKVRRPDAERLESFCLDL